MTSGNAQSDHRKHVYKVFGRILLRASPPDAFDESGGQVQDWSDRLRESTKQPQCASVWQKCDRCHCYVPKFRLATEARRASRYAGTDVTAVLCLRCTFLPQDLPYEAAATLHGLARLPHARHPATGRQVPDLRFNFAGYNGSLQPVRPLPISNLPRTTVANSFRFVHDSTTPPHRHSSRTEDVPTISKSSEI